MYSYRVFNYCCKINKLFHIRNVFSKLFFAKVKKRVLPATFFGYVEIKEKGATPIDATPFMLFFRTCNPT